MGTVYRALDREIGEEVALKVLSPEAMADPRAIERFRNELKLARRIVHKNVCRLYHFGEDRGTYYLVMEHVAGEDLRAILRRDGKLACGRAQAIALQVCEGLAEAHRLGIVHRDLKPGEHHDRPGREREDHGFRDRPVPRGERPDPDRIARRHSRVHVPRTGRRP